MPTAYVTAYTYCYGFFNVRAAAPEAAQSCQSRLALHSVTANKSANIPAAPVTGAPQVCMTVLFVFENYCTPCLSHGLLGGGLEACRLGPSS